MRRIAWMFAGGLGAAVVFWCGHAFATNPPGQTLHACITNSGALKANVTCGTNETPAVLVTQDALTAVQSRLGELESANANLASRVAALESANSGLQSLLSGVSRNGTTLTFSGMNVQIVDGLGSTDQMNGTGNLIVGYNQDRTCSGCSNDRTGSHNIIAGDMQNYTSYGGIVTGKINTISGYYATVTGGLRNTASGNYASVTGGYSNTASGDRASVTGGSSNTAGQTNSSVSGGFKNTASESDASVSGGSQNTASGVAASVSGGVERNASGTYNWAAGGLFEDN